MVTLNKSPAEYTATDSSNVNVNVVSATPALTVSLVAVAPPAITAFTYNLKVVVRAPVLPLNLIFDNEPSNGAIHSLKYDTELSSVSEVGNGIYTSEFVLRLKL